MKIKSFLTKALTGLMTLCIISGTSVTAFAAEVDGSDDGNPAIVSEFGTDDADEAGSSDDSRIPGDRTWNHPSSFSFTNYNWGAVRYVDGRWLAYELTCTSSTASYITVKTYVDGTLRDTSNIACDGNSHKVDWIDMQYYSGSHSIQFYYKAPSSSDTVYCDMIYYSWN